MMGREEEHMQAPAVPHMPDLVGIVIMVPVEGHTVDPADQPTMVPVALLMMVLEGPLTPGLEELLTMVLEGHVIPAPVDRVLMVLEAAQIARDNVIKIMR